MITAQQNVPIPKHSNPTLDFYVLYGAPRVPEISKNRPPFDKSLFILKQDFRALDSPLPAFTDMVDGRLFAHLSGQGLHVNDLERCDVQLRVLPLVRGRARCDLEAERTGDPWGGTAGHETVADCRHLGR